MSGERAGWRSWAARVLAVDEPPARVAAAVALGVFFGFSPFFGLQTLLAMSGAVLLRLNKVVVFVGLNANLPWIMLPWYAGTTMAAAAVMGAGRPGAWADIQQAVAAASVTQIWNGAFGALLWPFLVGATVGAAMAALVSYVVVASVLHARARRVRTPGAPA